MIRLREKTMARQLIVIFIIFVFSVPHSLAESSDVYIDEYRATIYPNGTLVEDFTYEISVKKYRMLYRLWGAPLSVDSLNQPYIELLENEAVPGAIGYYMDYMGVVSVNEPHKDNTTLINTIRSLAFSNEVGSYKPDYFNPGRYTVRYIFDIISIIFHAGLHNQGICLNGSYLFKPVSDPTKIDQYRFFAKPMNLLDHFLHIWQTKSFIVLN